MGSPGSPVIVVMLVAGVLSASAALVAAVIDVRRRRLPDPVVATVGLLPLVAAAVGFVGPSALLVGCVLLAGPFAIAHTLSPASIGFGDVKFAAVLGACVSVVDAQVALLAVSIASGMSSFGGLLVGRRSVPLGPGLVFGAVVAVVIGPFVIGGGA